MKHLEGLLRQDQARYDAGISFKWIKLRQALREDETYWKDTEEKAKNDMQAKVRGMADAFARYQREIMAIGSGLGRGIEGQQDFSLRKLPLWGEQVSLLEIDFEWPTLEEFDMMERDVSLQSLTLTGSGMLTSVQCTLTNDEVTDVFRPRAGSTMNQKTILFDRRAIRAVEAHERNLQRNNNEILIRELVFKDEEGSDLFSFNPLR